MLSSKMAFSSQQDGNHSCAALFQASQSTMTWQYLVPLLDGLPE